jgi:hypothetical protein
MEQKQYKIAKDKHTKARGGSSKFLSVYCNRCKQEILLYQKDGPGHLLRMYLDKILAPEGLRETVSGCGKKSDMAVLECPACKAKLAFPMIYEKENRLAYGIARGAVRITESDGKYPQVMKEKET